MTVNGVTPAWMITFYVAMNDIWGAITSSTGPVTNALSVITLPNVQFETATQYFDPMYSANFSSKLLVTGPIVINVESST